MQKFLAPAPLLFHSEIIKLFNDDLDFTEILIHRPPKKEQNPKSTPFLITYRKMGNSTNRTKKVFAT